MVAAALWVGAWLRGVASTDEVLEVLAGLEPDAAPVVRVGGGPPGPMVDLLRALPRASSAWLLLPRPGRTLGWPRDVAGEPAPAVLVAGAPGVGGLPDPRGVLVRHGSAGWTVEPVTAIPLTALSGLALAPRAAARALARALADGADRLGRLGLDRPAGAPAPTAWARGLRRLPRSGDPHLADLVLRIGDLRDVLDLALAEPGAAVTAAESATRDRELLRLVGEVEDLLVAAVAGAALRDGSAG